MEVFIINETAAKIRHNTPITAEIHAIRDIAFICLNFNST